MEDNSTTGKRLQKLTGSDFEVSDGQPDIRGWDVRDSEGKHIGEVDELIFDVQSRKVRYMVVDMDSDQTESGSRDVLVPIGFAVLDKSDDDVTLPEIGSHKLSALPKYDGGDISPATENSIRSILEGGGVALAAGAMMEDTVSRDSPDDFYAHEDFNDDNLQRNRTVLGNGENVSIPIIEEELNVGKRTVETGGARITSRITETPVEESIRLQQEHVSVERRAVDRPISPGDLGAFQEGVIELEEFAEVPVISKTARVVEEVTVARETEEHDETVRDTVRKTEVEIEDLGNEKSGSGAPVTS